MKVLIVEPACTGHHPFYLRLILRAFAGHERWVLSGPGSNGPGGEAGSDLPPDVRRVRADDGRPGPALAAAAELARREPFGLIFIPFIDLMLRELARGTGETLPRIAGIWMGPDALDPRYRVALPLAKRPRVCGRVHRWLRRPATAGRLRDLFFLSEHDVTRLARVAPAIRGHRLHDPPEAVSSLSQARARAGLGLPPRGAVLLHPGSAGRRKGLGMLLRAYARLDASDRQGAGEPPPFLYRVGPNELKPDERRQLDRMIERGRALATERFVPTAELADAFAACDWVAMPYRRFRHSSGILVNAAAAGRPVLAPDYGAIAQRVHAGQPGRLYRHGSVRALARELGRLAPLPTPVPRASPNLVVQMQRAFVETLAGWLDGIAREAPETGAAGA